VAFPPSHAHRWYLSSKLGTGAGNSLPVYRPVSLKALLGWQLAHTGVQAGIYRVFPRTTIPDEVQEALATLRIQGEIAALARTNHEQRWIALILSSSGPHSVAKIALDQRDAALLDMEHEKLRHFGRFLSPPIREPRVIHYEHGALVLEAVMSRPHLTSSVLPPQVAGSLGGFFSALNEAHSPPATGLVHGDFAPWNLLRHEDEWVLIDWESVATEQSPFLDLIHYHVQSYIHLGRPSLRSLIAGFSGTGRLSDSIRAYAEKAGHPPSAAKRYLHEYVRSTPLLIHPQNGRKGRPGARRRANRFLERVH
jgi:Phosphotransferase enzyme family